MNIVAAIIRAVAASTPEAKTALAVAVVDYRARFSRTYANLKRVSPFASNLLDGLEEVLDLREAL